MLRAFVYLKLASLRNLAARRALRFRQPQYLLAAAATAAYFYYFLFRPIGMVYGEGRRGAIPTAVVLFSALTMAGLLLVRPVLTWMGSGGLAFSEAEAAFLFPAPLSRRALIHFHLGGAQISTFVSALFFSLLSNRWVFLGGNGLTRFVGWWVVFATLSLHQSAAALTIVRLEEKGVRPGARRAVMAGLIALVAAGIAFSLWHNARLPRPADFSSGPSFQAYVAMVLGSGWMPVLLWPARVLARPFLARDMGYFLLHLEPALLLLAAHYLWIIRIDASFEERSIALARARGQARAALRAGAPAWTARPARAVAEPFRLGPRGRPEVAFLWKNLLSIRSSFNARVFIVPAMVLALVGARMFSRSDPAGRGALATVVAMVVAFYTLLFGPQFARQDLRSDLANADLLKTYPLTGWQVVLAEVLAPAALLSGVLWLCLLMAAASLRPGALPWLSPAALATAVLCLGVLAPVLCVLELLVPNAGMLLFPGWHQATRGRAGAGVEAIGQRLIFLFGQILLFLVALLPAAVYAVLFVAAAGWILGAVPAMLLGTAVALAILGGEIAVAVWWLGRRFERFDLTTDLRP